MRPPGVQDGGGVRLEGKGGWRRERAKDEEGESKRKVKERRESRREGRRERGKEEGEEERVEEKIELRKRVSSRRKKGERERRGGRERLEKGRGRDILGDKKEGKRRLLRIQREER